jgi:hypothetical protein
MPEKHVMMGERQGEMGAQEYVYRKLDGLVLEQESGHAL